EHDGYQLLRVRADDRLQQPGLRRGPGDGRDRHHGVARADLPDRAAISSHRRTEGTAVTATVSTPTPVPPTKAPRRSQTMTVRRRAAATVTVLLLVLGSLFVLLPLVWLLSTAFKKPDDAFAIPPKWL